MAAEEPVGGGAADEHDSAARFGAALDAVEDGRPLEPADLPADDQLPMLLPAFADQPRLLAIVHLLCDRADATATTSPHLPEAERSVLAALCQAVLATDSPALFGDCAMRLWSSPAALSVCGQQLAIELLGQAAVPPSEATARQVLRAADALEAATQLRLRGFAPRFDLFALLAAVTGPTGVAWSLAAARSLLACVEAWREGEELLPSLERLAGTVAPTANHKGPSKPDERQESDFAAALARAALVQALRAEERDLAVAHLERVLSFAGPALAEDDRPDVKVVAAVAAILRDLLLNGGVTDATIIPMLQQSVREHLWLQPGVHHWVGSRVAASHTAWAKLVRQLEQTAVHLGEASWYQAAAVIDDIVDLYRTSRSTRAFRRGSDDDAVRDIIAPMIEAGFAAQGSLLRHLTDHVDHLQSLADAGKAAPQELEDLPVAIELRDAVAERVRRGDVRPKPSAGGEAARHGSPGTPAERVTEAVARASALDRFTTGSLVADGVLERVRAGFAASSDYDGEVAEAADLVTHALVSFIHSREGLTSSARPYLFEPQVNESRLAADLQDYLVGNGHLGGVRTEVRHVGGGRVDVEFAFPGFNLYVELKVDLTATALLDKGAYLRQSGSYQTTDKRIGFLLVLKILRPKTVAPWFGDAVDVVEVGDGAGGIRHVAAFSLSGGRTAPSGM